MKIIPTPFHELLLLEPALFSDARGYFFETYQKERFEKIGIQANFIQDNFS